MDKEEIGYCDHDMSVIKYISNDWDRAGVVTIRCRKCNLADEIYADIPEGCSNVGSQKPQWFGSEPEWEDIDWSEPPKKDDLGDDVEWEAPVLDELLNRQNLTYLVNWRFSPDGQIFSPSSINFAGF